MLKPELNNFQMTFMQKIICYFVSFVCIVSIFLGLTQFFRVDHIKSKVHMRKKSSIGSSQVKQRTITTSFKSKKIRDEFILDFLKMCTLSDISLHKIDKMRPFLLKYCKEGGSIPSVNYIGSFIYQNNLLVILLL